MARPSDAAIIARHRARMFQEMGVLPDELSGALAAATEEELPALIASGRYLGWLASVGDDPAGVVAGVGLLIRPILPRPFSTGAGMAALISREGIILNAYTEPAHRRRGLARTLMKQVLDWTHANELQRVVLHASQQGKPLYEELGFRPGNEMRLTRTKPPSG